MTSYQKKKHDRIYKRNYYARDLWEDKQYRPRTIKDRLDDDDKDWKKRIKDYEED